MSFGGGVPRGLGPERTSPVQMLLVEDSPAEVVLTKEALRHSRIPINVSVVGDGVEALEFLRREARFVDAPRPDLVLLDLNLPRKSGHQVLADMAKDPDLASLPVVVLTASRQADDVNGAYREGANCYLAKPLDLDEFAETVRQIEHFWLELALLPSRRPDGRSPV